MLGFNPPAFRLVAVGAVVGTGAGNVFPQSESLGFQEGVKPGIEAVAVVDGVKPRLKGFSELIVGGL